MGKKRKKAQKNIKKKAISHFKDDMHYYAKESKEDSENVRLIKKSKKVPTKHLIKHLKGDQKGFKKEIEEDSELISKLKRTKNGISKSYKRKKK